MGPFANAEGEWQEVEYGWDSETERYYIQPSGAEPMYFDELQDPRLGESGLIHELRDLDEELQHQTSGRRERRRILSGMVGATVHLG